MKKKAAPAPLQDLTNELFVPISDEEARLVGGMDASGTNHFDGTYDTSGNYKGEDLIVDAAT